MLCKTYFNPPQLIPVILVLDFLVNKFHRIFYYLLIDTFLQFSNESSVSTLKHDLDKNTRFSINMQEQRNYRKKTVYSNNMPKIIANSCKKSFNFIVGV